MPARGQAVGCGVCDTPELWRGAAGLCARVRACAGAAESSGVAPRACARVYARVLVPPNLYTRLSSGVVGERGLLLGLDDGEPLHEVLVHDLCPASTNKLH